MVELNSKELEAIEDAIVLDKANGIEDADTSDQFILSALRSSVTATFKEAGAEMPDTLFVR